MTSSAYSYIFLINLPIGIVLLAFAAKHMRIERPDRTILRWIGSGVRL